MSAGYGKHRISFQGAVQLAAPHTWPAAVMPVLLGAAVSFAGGNPMRPYILLATLAVAVLLQSAINTLNDYRDFVSGLDSAENCLDPTDAALIYGCSSPKAALALGLAFLLLAAITGGALVICCGAVMLIYGGLALLAIVLYILPGISFSELPLGEALSGVTMGGVLTCAACHAQAGSFSTELVYLCLPAVMTVGCIMLVNNTSDIEKDREAGRRTLPVLLGRTAAQGILRVAVAAAALLASAFIALRFPRGIAAIPAMLAALFTNQKLWGIFRLELTAENRSKSMAAILSAHVCIITAYTAGIILSGMS